MNNLTIIILLVVLVIIYNMQKNEGFVIAVNPECQSEFNYDRTGNCVRIYEKDLYGLGKKSSCSGSAKICKFDNKRCCVTERESIKATCAPGFILTKSSNPGVNITRCCPTDEPKYDDKTNMCSK